MNFLHHEQIYRGKETLEKIKIFPLTVYGIGAIGSNLVENLVRQGFGSFTVIDKDRIEDRNVNTQVWTKRDIGMKKVAALKYHLFEIMSIEIDSFDKELRNKSKCINLFSYLERSLVIDAFDNSKSRQLIKDALEELHNPPDCLHIGFSGDYGEIIWNEDYQVPDDKGVDDCDYPLTRNLILLLVAVASEVIIKYVVSGIKENYTVTLKDFQIQQMEK